ncbi:MAG TPA: hypothetical protein VH834_07690 [Solirubrobacteraceae bacterium]|jgi:hypothetical protein
MASSDPSPGSDEREVFAGLPNARPQRRSAKRDRPARGGSARGAASPRAKPATKPKARAAPKRKATPKPKPAPEPVSRVPPAGYATPRDDVPRGADLIGTAVQAAGELAQIGIAASGRALKSAFQRLPRP